MRYAAPQDAEAAVELERIADREYASLDEVGEALCATEPGLPSAEQAPRPESGGQPGGADYLNPDPTPGAIRPTE